MDIISPENLEKLHTLTLQMAEVFVAFCSKNGLTCYLCGGGCIGAVRHEGWIPWDDDLDFFMPREDYEKAIILWKEQMTDTRYQLEVSDQNHIDGNLFFVIRDRMTTYIKPYQAQMDIVHGIVLDVLPLDGYPKGKWKRKVQCFWALIYSLYCAQAVPLNHGKAIRLIAYIMLKLIPGRRARYHIYMYAKRRMTKYPIADCKGITELCSGPGYMKNRYPKEAFERVIFLPFEGTRMPVPAGYDEYLTIAFGDYRKLPPQEKRVPMHDVIYMDLEHSYQKYRGIWYLTGGDKR